MTRYNSLIRYTIHVVIVLYLHYFFFYKVPLQNKKLFNELTANKMIFFIVYLYMIVSGL